MAKKADRKLMIVTFLKAYFKAHHFMSTIREICRSVDIKSTSLVQNYLDSLVDDGIISRINISHVNDDYEPIYSHVEIDPVKQKELAEKFGSH